MDNFKAELDDKLKIVKNVIITEYSDFQNILPEKEIIKNGKIIRSKEMFVLTFFVKLNQNPLKIQTLKISLITVSSGKQLNLTLVIKV